MPKTQARVLQFPPDVSIGRVYISDSYVRERFLAEARGPVEIPARRHVKLSITPAASGDLLQHLSALAHDDIEYLSLEHAHIRDSQLDPVYRLTGIQKLHFPFTNVDGTSFTKLLTFSNLTSVSAWWSRMRDVGLQHLSSLQGLEVLDVSRTQITDDGVRALVRARSLRTLVLQDNRVTDFAVTGLSSLPALQELYLGGTDLTDESLPSLGRMQNLVTLDIQKTKISQSGYERLRQALPNCKVNYDLQFACSQSVGVSSPI